MNRLGSALLATVVTVGVGGCAGLAPPNWFHPGPAEIQQGRAAQFDPYPDNDVGPSILGARPRGYEKPPAEPLRARWVRGRRG